MRCSNVGVQELEIENVKMREDMTKLRRSIAEGAEDSENEAVSAKN